MLDRPRDPGRAGRRGALETVLLKTSGPDDGAAQSPEARDAPRPSEAVAGANVCELTVVVPTFNEAGNVAAMVAALRVALEGIAWQVIFVDDDSPDGTASAVKAIAAADPRVQCIRRVGRRGLAGAVIEGAMASAAPYVAVIDGDMQHDETLLPKMLRALRSGDGELAIASRYLDTGETVEGLSGIRRAGSRLANWLGRRVLHQEVNDPVSGFFMIERGLLDAVASKLSTEGFKVLFDIIASQPKPLRLVELPYTFRERNAGGSKLDRRVVIEYLGLLLSKSTHDIVSTRALMFAMVGASGVLINLGALRLLMEAGHRMFSPRYSDEAIFNVAQISASMIAMTSNYLINNAVTYRDRRKHGWDLLVGYLKFCGFCSVGLVASFAVANLMFRWTHAGMWAGLIGAGFGALWNYVTASIAVW
jgi:dolichol-phosphate mannosyltransferase